MSLSRIIRREQVTRLREADRILHDAEKQRLESQQQSARMQQDILSDARLQAMKEAAQTAARMISRAEQAAEDRMRNMEPELARLVAQTVRSILGDFEPEEASYLSARTALRQLRDHRRGRIFAAEDSVAPVRRAVAELGDDGPEILSVIPDPAFDPGRVVLTSNRGSTEIGLPALTDRALSAWQESSAGGDDPAGTGAVRGSGTGAPR